MPIDYPQVLERRTEGEGAWTNQETILYALGVGMGADPMDEKELAFVFEKDLKALPTFASVIRARPVTSTGPEARMQLNPVLIVDGERNITFHKPVPAAAKVKTKGRVVGVFDKGKDKGARGAQRDHHHRRRLAIRSPPYWPRCSPAATAASVARRRASPSRMPYRRARPTSPSTWPPRPTRR